MFMISNCSIKASFLSLRRLLIILVAFGLLSALSGCNNAFINAPINLSADNVTSNYALLKWDSV